MQPKLSSTYKSGDAARLPVGWEEQGSPARWEHKQGGKTGRRKKWGPAHQTPPYCNVL